MYACQDSLPEVGLNQAFKWSLKLMIITCCVISTQLSAFLTASNWMVYGGRGHPAAAALTNPAPVAEDDCFVLIREPSYGSEEMSNPGVWMRYTPLVEVNQAIYAWSC